MIKNEGKESLLEQFLDILESEIVGGFATMKPTHAHGIRRPLTSDLWRTWEAKAFENPTRKTQSPLSSARDRTHRWNGTAASRRTDAIRV